MKKSKREIERELSDFEGVLPGPTLAEVWTSDLREGESYDLDSDEWADLLKSNQ